MICFLLVSASVSGYAQAPVAKISAIPTAFCPGQAASFNDVSTGGAVTSRVWSFPGGTPSSSTALSVPVTYTTSGPYTVTLTVTNASGSSTTTQGINVYSTPAADFTQNKTTGCFPTNIQFTNTSTAGTGASITSYSWTFGDGTQDTVASPNHRYTVGGSLPVTLYVKNNFGCVGTAQIKNVQKAITLSGQIIPNFSSTLNTSCTLPVTAMFTNTSTGPAVLSYSWDFGDGSPADNTMSPSHSYTTANNYTVKLSVTSSQGCSDTLPLSVNITSTGNITDFTKPDTVCANSVVDFKNTSSPFPNTSTWDYGDLSPVETKRNGQHTYTAAGTYSVLLTNTFSGCGGSQTKNIVVVVPPVAAFNATNANSCQPPVTSTFTDGSIGATAWEWDFGDGSPKYYGKTPPPHTFTGYGNYVVKLTASSVAGCASTSPLAINIIKPKVKISNLPAYGCAPYVFTPAAAATTIDGVAGYSWNFGNGNTSTSATPPPQTYGVGTFKVYVTITTLGGCQASDTGYVKVGLVKPTPSFNYAPAAACVKSGISFSGTSTPADQWLWSFGDGSTDTSKNIVYKYTKPGVYNVKLTSYNSGCWDTISHVVTINPPAANFSFSSIACSKNNFQFKDSSSPGTTSWQWDFGDGNSATTQNPTHNYAVGAPATLTVKLIASTATCSDTIPLPIKTNQSTVLAFSAASLSACVNTPVTITATAPGTISKYVFVYGDGQRDTTKSNTATHTYTTPNASYAVKVITTDATSGCIDSSAVYPLVINGVLANFRVPPSLSCGALTVNFKDSSVVIPAGSSITKWAWDFGDGGTSTQQNPIYTYTIQGNFVPRLTITDINGCVSTYDTAKPITISIMNPKFTVNDTLSCPNAPIQTKFINSSFGGFFATYSWNFGDGSPANTNVSPTHVYNLVGLFNDTLTMTDSYGCVSKYGGLPIRIDTPHAAFTMSGNYSACPVFNDTFTFTGHYAKSYAWDFRDGGISQKKDPVNGYALPGDYWPYLSIISPGGCVSLSDSQLVHIEGPLGTLTYTPLQACDSLTVNFTVATSNVVTFLWIPGDGSNAVTTTTNNFSHTYTKPGQFFPIVYITDAGGCKLSKVGVDTIQIDGIKSTSFAADKIIVCDTGTVNFTNTSVLSDPTTIITNYHWDFGDGNTMDGMNPNISHKFLTLGVDSVSLTLTTRAGCTDTYKKAISIVPAPKISFTGLLNQCEPAVLTFAGTETPMDPNGPLAWAWNFGNGQTASVRNPPDVSYPKAGEYVVYVKATNTKGCSTMTDTAGAATHLFIYPVPTVNAGPDVTICDTSFLQLNATGNATSYNWSNPTGGNLSCTNCSNPVASSSSSTYFVLTGTTLNFCKATDTINVTVNTPVTITASGTDSVCLGQSTQLNASGGAIYSWSPAAGLSDPNIANPVSKPDAGMIGTGASNVFTYTVTGYDNRRCYSDTKTIDVTAFKYPEIDLVPNATINVGNTYQIMSTASTNIVSLNWTPPNYLSCTNCLTPVAKPITTTKYSLTAINDGGCATTDSIRIQVICTGANFFVPNSFSPNGDGVNDYFIVNGVGLNVIPSISIYNRWGQMVFQKSNFAPNSSAAAWDGTFNGQPAPPDVYIYTIQILCDNATLIPYHGNVTLIR